MTTIDNFPSESELEALANGLFPGYNTAECADGIDKLVTKGDTSVIDRAVHKSESLPFQSEMNRLDGYARAAEEILSEASPVTADEFYPDVSPLDGFSPVGSLNAATLPFTDITSAAQVSEHDIFRPKYTPDEKDFEPVISELDGFEIYRAEQAPEEPKTSGYSPVVLSQAQSESYSPKSRTDPSESGNFRQNGNNSIIVGTKTLEQIRRDFPILGEKINGHDLVWLDNGATTQRPQQVIDRLSYYYSHENSNVHRGAHTLAARSTDAYEGARQTVADFIGAPDKSNIIFVRGTTEGINLVAQAYVKQYLHEGDEIILTMLEHHANIVPWQLIAQETGAVIKVAPVDKSGQIIISEYEKLFTKRTRFVSATHVSNVLGTITPVAELISIAHAHGVRILIDGAQSAAHIPVDVTALDADLFVFSGHKIYAPTGIGVVYGKKEILEAARPYQGGGNMIADVTFERTIYNPAPNKFEAGTASIGDAVALGAALEYLNSIGMPEVSRYEHELVSYGMKELAKIPGLHLIGTASQKSSALSFVLDGYDNETVGQHLDKYGIAVRTGHHCAQPILRSYGLEGVVRPTLALYNSPEDIDRLVRAIRSLT
ncbi:MAG: SufS family cysteine desulfurase [Oscillospiraceae bacterium]